MRSRGRRPRPARRAVLIVCEGRNTEPCYFRQIVATLRLSATVAVEIHGAPGCTDPRGLVEFAMEKKREREHDARHDLTKAEFEETWVVFDVEHPENGRQAAIPGAVQVALNHDLSIALSNPSFEAWYILHDRPTPPGLSCSADALSVLGRILGHELDKSRASANALAEWAMPRTAVALRHGERQDVLTGEPTQVPAHVPSATGTGVHRAVRSLVSMSSDAAGKRKLGFPEGE
jgi:RloB-like protein